MKQSRPELRIIPPTLIGVAFIFMLALTWQRWPDPLVDFGRELYVPWRLSQAEVLYRDIAHLNGPLSQYFNALIFKIFRASMQTLVMTNIAIAIAVIVMTWKLFRLAGDRLSATVACLLFITLFMAMQYVGIGNYNWITPYSHEITHGVALSMLAILMIVRFQLRRRDVDALLCGLLLGLIFLTKPEIFAAAAITVICGFAFARPGARAVVAFALAAFLPVAISAIALSWRDTLGAWMYLFDSRISSMHFYKLGMGTDEPIANMRRAILQLLVCVLIFAPAWLADRTRRKGLMLSTSAAVVIVVLLADWRGWIEWHESARGLTPLMIIASIIAMARFNKRSPRGLVRAMLILFSTLLLAKIFLMARFYHYGFALAMPATLVAAAFLTGWIPRPRQWSLRIVAVLVLGLCVYRNLNGYARSFRSKKVVVAAETSDEFRAGDRGAMVNQIIAGLKNLPLNATLAVVPQGVMVNYLTGRVNPTGYLTLMPPEVISFGDDRIVGAFERTVPDFVLIIPEDFGEYGFASFQAFAPKTAEWIRANYAPVATLPHRPLPIVLLKRIQ